MNIYFNSASFKDFENITGMDVGTTASAVIRVKIGDTPKTLEAGKLLPRAGVYANPTIYPAVCKKNTRFRMNLMATQTTAHLDQVLNAFKEIDHQLQTSKNDR